MTKIPEVNDQAPAALCDRTPIGLLAELTHRCPFQCPYCSNPIELEKVDRELSTEEWLRVFQQAADLGILQTHLSGGEPTLRKDLEDIVAQCAKVGLYSNLITAGGPGLTFERLSKLADLGLDHVQVSIDDVDEENANYIGGFKRGYQTKVELIKWVNELELPLTINVPFHRHNIDNLEKIIDYGVEVGAQRLEVAHVQYYGWAFKNRASLIPTYDQTVWSLEVVKKAKERLKGVMAFDAVIPDYYAKRPKPCMGGWASGFMNVTPSGKVLPCHAAESITSLTFDNVKERGLEEIWHHSNAFNKYRGTDWMPEPCKSCDLKEVDWGGCRCQAFAFTGDAANTDPACSKSSFHAEIVEMATREAKAPPKPFIYRNYREADALMEEKKNASEPTETVPAE